MTSIDLDQLATDSTDTWLDYTVSMTVPGFSALEVACNNFGKMLNKFFAFENHPQIPFSNTPQGAIFRGFNHKEVQIKRRILEYRAKY
jgi:hypothetical protein